VYRAALDLVAESDLSRSSRSEITTRAKVSRQTLYNRWESVGDIVPEALRARGAREIGTTDTVRPTTSGERLHDYVDGLAAALNRWAAPGLKATPAPAQQDPAVAALVRTEFIEPRQRWLVEVVEYACEKAQHDPEAVAALIAASIWYRLLVSGRLLNAAWVKAMVSLVQKTGR